MFVESLPGHWSNDDKVLALLPCPKENSLDRLPSRVGSQAHTRHQFLETWIAAQLIELRIHLKPHHYAGVLRIRFLQPTHGHERVADDRVSDKKTLTKGD